MVDHLNLPEGTMCTQASLLFSLAPPPKKVLKGLNKRAQHSIQLIEEKNNLLSQIQVCMNQKTKASLQALLDIVCKLLGNFRHGEKNRKKQ